MRGFESVRPAWPEMRVADDTGSPAAPLQTRVHFSLHDVAQTRFLCAPAPLVETVLGLVELRRRPAGVYARSQRERPTFLPSTARPLLELIPATGYWPEFLDPPVVDLDEGLDIVRATPRQVLREQIAEAWTGAASRPSSWLRAVANGEPEALELVQRGLADLYAALIAPLWGQVLASFRQHVGQQASAVAAGGLAAGFSTLHADLAWRDGLLVRECRAGWAGDLWLEGAGLQLVPAVLWSGPPLFSINSRQPSRNALIYPLYQSGSPMGPPDLTGLMGRTRAAVLKALHDPCSTTELAARVGISPASASEHAAALRTANLIQTVRCGRGVRHSLTSVGRSLLTGC